MMRRATTPVLSVLLLLVLAAPAAAQSVRSVASDIRDDGYFAEGLSSADRSNLDAVVRNQRTIENRIYLAWLDSEPSEFNDVFAEDVVNQLGGGTVIVVSPQEIGAYSSEFSSSEVDRAVDASFDAFDTSPARGFADFADSLGARVGATSTGSSGSSGGLPWGWIFIIGIVGLIGFTVWNGKRSSKKAAEVNLTEVKAALTGKLDEVANEILENEDRVRLSEDPEVQTWYSQASATFAEAQNALEGAASVQDLRDVTIDLDEAYWQLQATEAKMDGRAIPARPEPAELEPLPEPDLDDTGGSSMPMPPPAARGRRGGMGGGMMGGMAGGVFGEVLDGMMSGGMGQARRYGRRTSRRYGSGIGGAIGGLGGLAGGSRSRGSSRRSSGGSSRRSRGGGSSGGGGRARRRR